MKKSTKIIKEEEFELLEKRTEEISKFKNEIKGMNLDEPWACKKINKTHKRVLKDPLYSDWEWFEGSIIYLIIQPSYRFDLLSSSKFKIISEKPSKVEMVWRKEPIDYWEREWEMMYDLYIEKSEKNFISYPPEFVGKGNIIKSINDAVELVDYKPPEHFMNSIKGETFGEKIYSIILSEREVVIHPNKKGVYKR